MYRQRCLTSFHEPNGWFMLFPSRKSLAMYIACFGNTAYHAQSWTNASFLSLSPQIQSRVYNASLKSDKFARYVFGFAGIALYN
jgi:hypothetical protein